MSDVREMLDDYEKYSWPRDLPLPDRPRHHRSPGRWGVRFFEAPDHTGEPWIWAEWDGGPAPILGRNDFEGALLSVWPHIVRALTAGPTLESARVVIDTLREEIAALTAANRDLNAELTSIRRENARP